MREEVLKSIIKSLKNLEWNMSMDVSIGNTHREDYEIARFTTIIGEPLTDYQIGSSDTSDAVFLNLDFDKFTIVNNMVIIYEIEFKDDDEYSKALLEHYEKLSYDKEDEVFQNILKGSDVINRNSKLNSLLD